MYNIVDLKEVIIKNVFNVYIEVLRVCIVVVYKVLLNLFMLIGKLMELEKLLKNRKKWFLLFFRSVL